RHRLHGQPGPRRGLRPDHAPPGHGPGAPDPAAGAGHRALPPVLVAEVRPDGRGRGRVPGPGRGRRGPGRLTHRGRRQAAAMTGAMAARYSAAQQPMAGTRAMREPCRTIRLSPAPPSAASMASSAGAVSCQSVNTSPNATGSIDWNTIAPVTLPRARVSLAWR